MEEERKEWVNELMGWIENENPFSWVLPFHLGGTPNSHYRQCWDTICYKAWWREERHWAWHDAEMQMQPQVWELRKTLFRSQQPHIITPTILASLHVDVGTSFLELFTLMRPWLFFLTINKHSQYNNAVMENNSVALTVCHALFK